MDDDEVYVLVAASAGDTTCRYIAEAGCSAGAVMAHSIYAARESEEARLREWESTLEYSTTVDPPCPNAAALFEQGFRQKDAELARLRTQEAQRRTPWFWGRKRRGR